jgi:hypothetical protein
MELDQSKSSNDDITMNDVSHKDTDFSNNSQESEFNNGSDVNRALYIIFNTTSAIK